MHSALTPYQDMTIVSVGSTTDGPTWKVTGGRPMFLLDEVPPPGWYIVKTDVDGESETDDTPIALRFLPSTGSVALARRPIPLIRGRRSRVVHVPHGAMRAQLEVSPWLTSVSGSHVSFRSLPTPIAASLMSADVAASSVLGTTDRSALLSDLRAARSSAGLRGAIEQIAIAYEHLQHRRAGDGVDYPSWRIRNATIFDDDAERLWMRATALPGGGPSISVLMPVHNPDERWLRGAIESVRAQVYDRWELVIVDDASTSRISRRVLEEFADKDPRIRVRFRSENGHISRATNDALEIATGEFVAFLDHDDELAPFALAAVALESANADVVYTDEDKIDGSGRHFDPHCKPPWNPELLLGQNYMSHLTVIRRSVVEAAGGLRPGLEGAQDHDLLLRVTATTPPSRIVHVPLIAYHWRATAGSTAHGIGEKSYTEKASIDALRDRLGDLWDVAPGPAPSTFRCTPPMIDYPLVSILIPTRDRVDLLRRCIDGLVKTSYPAFEVIVIDNDSTDAETLEWLDAFDNGHDHRVVRHRAPFNYSAINNHGANEARGDMICLLNNDTEVIEPDWLSEMVRWIQQPGVGVVGAKLLYDDDTIQHAGVVLGLGGLAGHGHHRYGRDEYGYFSRLAIAHEVGAVTGACLLTLRSTWDLLGGLAENLAIAFNDVDYCLRVRHEAGQRIIWTPHALLYHHESLSRGAEDNALKVARFNAEVEHSLDRWADLLECDPAYSPNLSLHADSFTLARQPRLTPPWRAIPELTPGPEG